MADKDMLIAQEEAEKIDRDVTTIIALNKEIDHIGNCRTQWMSGNRSVD